MNIIQLENVSKTYRINSGIIRKKVKNVTALSNISFSIKSGEIFCPIGPNGAGKTTLIKLMSTLAIPNTGQILIEGYDVVSSPKVIRRKIGVLFGGERGLYLRISARDNLLYFGNLYEIPKRTLDKRVDELLALVGMEDRQDDSIETFSKGMKQRIHLARCLLHDPDIIFLDEPTLGLDVEVAKKMRSVIRNLKEQGKTIILTSHYMNEIEELADHIALIFKGQLQEITTVQKFKSKVHNSSNLEDAYLSVIKKQEVGG